MRRVLLSWAAIFILGRCTCDGEPGLVTVEPKIDLVTTLDFGEVPIGATKRIEIPLANIGNAELHVLGFDVSPPFGAELGSLTLGPGRSAPFDVSFHPDRPGPISGQLVLRSDAKDGTEVVVALSGQGVVGQLSLQPTRVDFGSSVVGTERLAAISLFNGGGASVAGDLVSEGFDRPEHWELTGVAHFGDATPFEVAAGSSQGHQLTYRPLAESSERGRVRFEICGPRCGLEVEVVASATRSRLFLEPGALDFGEVGLGADRSLQLQVQGANGPAVNVRSVRVSSSDFEVVATRALPTPVDASTSLGLTVRFRPSGIGDVRSELVVETDDPAAPQLVARLEARGIGPTFEVVPSPLHFGVERGPGTYRRSLLLISAGSGRVVVTGFSLQVRREFSLVDPPSVPIILEAGESATVEVTFAPAAFGEFQDVLTVQTDAGPTDVPLLGGAAERLCELEVDPTPLEMGMVTPGLSRDRAVTIRNAGGDPCELASAAFRAPIDPTITTAAWTPITLLPGDSTDVSFHFAPVDRRDAKAAYDITTTDPVFPIRSISVRGRSNNRGSCLLVEPDALDFGAVRVGQQRRLSVLVSNVGTTPCRILATRLAPGGDSALIVPAVSEVIPVGQRHAFIVEVAPTIASLISGVLEIDTDDSLAPRFEIPLSAVSLEPSICVEPRNLDFGPAGAPATLSFEIRACRSTAVDLIGIDWTTAAPELALGALPALPSTLAAGQAINVDVTYNPGAAPTTHGVVTVRSNDLVEPEIPVSITGGTLIAPPEAGRFLYFWQIGSVNVAGVIARQPLQGAQTTSVLYGDQPGQGCVGCHSVSPDGHYVAMLESGSGFVVIDTVTQTKFPFPPLPGLAYFSDWNPDITAGNGYELVYSDGSDLHLASLNTGELGVLQGADDPALGEVHPSWGPDGKIAFARGWGGGFGVGGDANLVEVPETGGAPSLVIGASGNQMGNYYPSYSPDGRWLAFTQSPGALGTIAVGDARVRLVRTDGSGLVIDLFAANALGVTTSFPTWSVDGRLLSFSVRRTVGDSWDIYMVPIDTTTGIEGIPVELTSVNTPAFEHGALWSP